MAPVIAFWAVSLLVGALALPIAFASLRRLPDAGVGLSFPLGLVLAGWAYFTLRTLSILPPGRGGYLLALALLGITSVAVAGRDRRFVATLRRAVPSLFMVAGLFTLAFFAFVIYRSQQPNVTGTEQPMDFMYLNATLASGDYPPHDPWLAGNPASYYYFGYLQMGLLTSAAGVSPEYGYNLGLAYTFAAAATGIASLAIALTRWAVGSRGGRWMLASGALAVVLLLGVGSLSAVFEVAAAHGYDGPRGLYERMGLEWMIPCPQGVTEDCFQGPTNPRTASWYPDEFWWWWRGTRIIPHTITEFPFFSFLLGDMHPHVMSIPLVLLSLGLAASLWRGRSLLRFRSHRRPWPVLLLAVVLGGLAFQNAWDLLTFTGLVAAVVFARNLRATRFLPATAATLGYLWPILFLAVAAYAPWYADFTSQASGFYAYTGEGTRPAHAFLQFGPLLLAALAAATWSLRGIDRQRLGTALLAGLWVPLLPLIGWMALAAVRGDFGDGVDARGGHSWGGAGGWVTLFAYGATTWLLAASFISLAVQRCSAAIVPGLATTGALLLYGAELFLIRDIFFGAEPRLNTVFKLSYQAWILLSVAGGVAAVVALERASKRRTPAGWLAVPALALCALGLVYPVTALAARVAESKDPATMDGLAFVARSDPGEYALVQWIRGHTAPGDVVIEASGRTWGRGQDGRPVVTNAGVDYSEAGRVSARTGRQTPIGWYFHEVQWRGEGPAERAELDRRQLLADSPYIAQEPADVLAAMREAGAEYLVVGKIERTRFPGLLPDFASFLDIAFDAQGVRVYRLPRYSVVHTS